MVRYASLVETEVNRVHREGLAPLTVAAINVNLACLRPILAHPLADPNVQARADGWTALHWAALRNSVKLVRALLKAPDIDLEVTDNAGQTPLDKAIKTEVRDLLEERMERDRVANVRPSKRRASTDSGEIGEKRKRLSNGSDAMTFCQTFTSLALEKRQGV